MTHRYPPVVCACSPVGLPVSLMNSALSVFRWLCHRVCSCFRLLWSLMRVVGRRNRKVRIPQRLTLRVVPRPENKQKAAPTTQESDWRVQCALGNPGLDRPRGKALGSQSEVLDLPLYVHLGQGIARASCWAHCHSSCY